MIEHGAPVTGLVRWAYDSVAVRRGYAGSTTLDGFITDSGVFYAYSAENIWWLHGHYADDSPEVDALRAAQALAQPL